MTAMTLTIIGAGKMGEALARGILCAGLVTPANLTLADIDARRLQLLASELGIVTTTDNEVAVRDAEIVILAVKPKDILTVCRDLSAVFSARTIVVSIAAGTTLRQLAGALERDDLLLARAMPNTPCLVGAGAIGLSFSAGASAQHRQQVVQLLAATGTVAELPESLLDAVTGLSGSGPAYVAILIEALADGGVLMGLPRAEAQALAIQTVFGTAKLLADTGQHPAQVKDGVSSPAGTTIAGIAALEQAGFRAAIISAVQAASLRARALSGE